MKEKFLKKMKKQSEKNNRRRNIDWTTQENQNIINSCLINYILLITA